MDGPRGMIIILNVANTLSNTSLIGKLLNLIFRKIAETSTYTYVCTDYMLAWLILLHNIMGSALEHVLMSWIHHQLKGWNQSGLTPKN